MTIGEARKKGILDNDLTTFRDLRNSKDFSIQEAIDNQHLVATLDNSNSASPTEPTSNGKLHHVIFSCYHKLICIKSDLSLDTLSTSSVTRRPSRDKANFFTISLKAMRTQLYCIRIIYILQGPDTYLLKYIIYRV